MKRALSATVAVGASVALLAPLVATADHRPGHRANPPNPDLSIAAEPDVQRWPRQVTISGRLHGPDNTGKTIELGENPHPFTGGFRSVGTTTTDAQGDYSFQVRPEEHTNYRVRTVGIEPPEVSAVEAVRSRMKITRRVSDKTPADGEEITFSGRVGPAHEGLHVLIQRRRPSGTWRTVTSTPLGEADADNHSPYSTDVQINRDGVWRARIRGDENHLGNKSRRVRFEVH